MKIYTTKPRPEAIPASWTIYNAPRPLYGDTEWRGDFLTGIFYAAVDPNADIATATWMIRTNETNGAAEVVYVTETQAIEAYLRNNRHADKYRQMLADSDKYPGLWSRQVISVLDMLNEGKLEL